MSKIFSLDSSDQIKRIEYEESGEAATVRLRPIFVWK